MSKPLHQFGRRVISGEDRSLLARIARAGMVVVEPIYAGVMRLRNSCFDRRWKSILDLGRPAISVGNITTGGTGKTPIVLWLATRLRDRGYHPAILLRGYGSKPIGVSDEQQLLDLTLNAGSAHPIPVIANPSRVEGARTALAKHPDVDLFILDDGFQHRKAKRDFDLVLISASEPFGFGHVLPRGLLREPLSGLKRATAFLITRQSQATDGVIEQKLANFNATASIYRSDHVHSAVWFPSTNDRLPLARLSDEKIFAFAGIGDPESFALQLAKAGCQIVGRRWFADHHPYSTDDLGSLTTAAKKAGATRLLTTGKDWVKLAPIRSVQGNTPIGVVELSIEMSHADERALLEEVVSAIGHLQGG